MKIRLYDHEGHLLEIDAIQTVVQAHKYGVIASLADSEIFEFTAPRACTLDEVQVYCTDMTATASVDVKEDGTSVLSAAATPIADTVVKPSISDDKIAAGAAITVHVTTNFEGAITDLTVTLTFGQSGRAL